MADDRDLRLLLDRTAVVDVVVGIANALDAKDRARLRSLVNDPWRRRHVHHRAAARQASPATRDDRW